jgi:hypothetical protein
MRLRGQRATDADNVGPLKQVIEAHEFDSEFSRERAIRVGIVSDQLSNGLIIRKSSAPIFPMPFDPSVRPTRPTPMYSPLRANPAAPSRVSRSLTMSLPVSARMSVMIETATGRQARCRCALRGGLRYGRRRRVHKCRHRPRDYAGWIAWLKISELDPRRLTQGFEVEVRIYGRAVRFAEIAGKSDAKGLAHDVFPRFCVIFCFSTRAQPSRSLPIASERASCSTQTSPE